MEKGTESKLEIIEAKIKDDRWKTPIMHGALWHFENDSPTSQPMRVFPLYVRGARFWRSNIKRHCVKIERGRMNPFYFYSVDSYCTEEWVEKLKYVGGVFSGLLLYDDVLRPEFCLLSSVKQWKNEHVQDWLSFQLCMKQKSNKLYLSKYEYLFGESGKGINGKKLLGLTMIELMELHVKIFHCYQILKSTEYMKQNKNKFDFTFFTVLNKLIRMTNGKKFDNLNHEKHAQFISYLTDVKTMTETYLTLETKISNPKKNCFINTQDSYIPKKGMKRVKKSDEELEEKYMEIDTYEDVFDSCLSMDIFSNHYAGKGKFYKLPVRFILNEMLRNHKKESCQEILSPLITRYPGSEKLEYDDDTGKPKFYVYPSLMIGPWYLEWNESSLVVPKRIHGSIWSYIKRLRLSPYLRVENTAQEKKNFVRKLASVVCEFNRTKQFDWERCNGQHFIDAICKAIGYSFPKNLVSQVVMKEMRGSSGRREGRGRYEFKLPLTRDFRKRFYHKLSANNNLLMKKQYEYFSSHAELDGFVNDLNHVNAIGLQIDYKDEGYLMESFDHSFWFRVYNELFGTKKKNVYNSIPHQKYIVPLRRGYFDPVRSWELIKCDFLGNKWNSALGLHQMYSKESKEMVKKLFPKYQTIHYHKSRLNLDDPKNNVKLRCNFSSYILEMHKKDLVLYFGDPFNWIITAITPEKARSRYKNELKRKRIGIYSSKNLKYLLEEEVPFIFIGEETSPRFEIDSFLKWDEKSFLVGLSNTHPRYGDGFVISFSIVSNSNNNNEDAFKISKKAKVNKEKRMFSLSFDRKIVSYTNLSSPSWKNRLVRAGKDTFIIEGKGELLFVSYRNGSTFSIKKKRTRVTKMIQSKCLEDFSILIGTNFLDLVNSSTMRIEREIPISEIENAIVGNEVEYNVENFQNVSTSLEEVVVIGRGGGGERNDIVIVGINYQTYQRTLDPETIQYSSKCVKLDESTIPCSLVVIKNTYLCVGDAFGFITVFHIDFSSTESSTFVLGKGNNDLNLECKKIMESRHHYSSIWKIVCLDDSVDTSCLLHSQNLATFSSDYFMTLCQMNGLRFIVSESVMRRNVRDSKERFEFITRPGFFEEHQSFVFLICLKSKNEKTSQLRFFRSLLVQF